MSDSFIDMLTKKVGDLIATEFNKNEMNKVIEVTENDVIKVIKLVQTTDTELAQKLFMWYKNYYQVDPIVAKLKTVARTDDVVNRAEIDKFNEEVDKKIVNQLLKQKKKKSSSSTYSNGCGGTTRGGGSCSSSYSSYSYSGGCGSSGGC